METFGGVIFLGVLAFVLSDPETLILKSWARTERKTHAQSAHTREKRALPDTVYTANEQQQIVDKHNEYRKAAGASNMQYMVRNQIVFIGKKDILKITRERGGHNQLGKFEIWICVKLQKQKRNTGF